MAPSSNALSARRAVQLVSKSPCHRHNQFRCASPCVAMSCNWLAEYRHFIASRKCKARRLKANHHARKKCPAIYGGPAIRRAAARCRGEAAARAPALAPIYSLCRAHRATKYSAAAPATPAQPHPSCLSRAPLCITGCGYER